MHVIVANNVNDALRTGLKYLNAFGVRERRRDRNVIEAPGPVTTIFNEPNKCVLFDGIRDANPFFHMMEALWILAGRDDVKTMAFYNSNIGNYSDDGHTFHGAYGHRLRVNTIDQLLSVIWRLREDPNTRQAMMGIWQPRDLLYEGRDTPCNTTVMFHKRGEELSMTVTNRSNDVIWGAYGANAVQFSFLLQFVAACVGLRVGKYYQVSNNYHVYTEQESAALTHRLMDPHGWLEQPVKTPYDLPFEDPIRAWPFRLVSPEEAIAPNEFLAGVENFFEYIEETMRLVGQMNEFGSNFIDEFWPTNAFNWPEFVRYVALPLHVIWCSRKLQKSCPAQARELRDRADARLMQSPTVDWVLAARQWMARRPSGKV